MRLSFTLLLTIIVSSAGCKTQSLSGNPTSSPPTRVERDDLVTRTRPLRDEPTYYQPPTVGEAMAFKAGLRELLSKLKAGAEPGSVATAALRKAGLRLQTLDGTQTWIAIFEGGKSWRGAGTYVFRTGEAAPLVIQAPHGWHDQNTATLAYEAFRRTNARALFFNTIHRYRATPEERKHDELHVADLAHTTDSFFYYATQTFLENSPDAAVVQLHGFANSKLEREGIEVVISDGTDEPEPHVEKWRQAFAGAFGEARVAGYPAETQEYGATSNTIGRLVRLTNRGKFVHVEMSGSLRDDLLEDITPLVDALRTNEPE